MPFPAELIHIEPPKVIRIKKGMLRGSPNSTQDNLQELVDRVEATTHAAAAAPKGVASRVWRSFIEEHPGVEDPFARVVQAAPDIADATARKFIDNLMGSLEREGLGESVKKLSEGIEGYYRQEDSNGNPCNYNEKTGEFVSSGGGACLLVKTAGGGMSLVKKLVDEATRDAKGETKAKIETAVRDSMQDLVNGPQRLWDKLSDAWKTTILLAGLAASTPRITGLKLSGDKIEFTIPPGIGSFSGNISIENGKLQKLGATLPPVRIKGLTIKSSGSYSDGSGRGTVSMVVPVKKSTAGMTVSHEQSAKYQKTTVESTLSRPIGDSGKIQAGTKSEFSPGSKVSTEYSLSVSTPVGKTKSVSLSAGVTGAVTTSGQRVEMASNPAVTASLSGKLPSLNRNIRKNEQAAYRERQEADNLKTREASLVATLQQMDPKTQKNEMWQVEQELIEVRRKMRGSANLPPEIEVNGDLVVAAATMTGVAYLALKRHQEKR